MTDCVLDSSALILALAGKTDWASALRARLMKARRHAPHLIDAARTDLGGARLGLCAS